MFSRFFVVCFQDWCHRLEFGGNSIDWSGKQQGREHPKSEIISNAKDIMTPSSTEQTAKA
jgi:hypothetical protein